MSVRTLGLLVLCFAAGGIRAAEVMPAPPRAHFNDYASVVSPATAQALDTKLADFERQTSNQVVVAIYPRFESDSSVEDYSVRVAQSWHVGQKGKDNGAVLFIFAQTHQIYLEVGYGLEGALPDALAKRIISDEIVPRFRKGDFDGGVVAGVNAVMAATQGEYRGTGRTAADRNKGMNPIAFLFLLFIVVVFIITLARKNAAIYHGGGRGGFGGPMIFPGGFGGGGGFSGGGGGGGFSGGGGSFGGGGAGGSW